MKIRIRTNLGSAEYPGMPWRCGDEQEVDEALGASLVARGVAEDISEPKPAAQPKKVAGVPDKPAISEAKPAAVFGNQPKGDFK